ncbi:MAG: 16S rRNA (cytidine(1402)-2'-O)-methyltransferase [Bdellovibrionia bacterium]
MVQNSGTLYIVALPIGNSRDITLRAIDVLNQADVIACEDTRTFNEAASGLGVTAKKTVSHHEHNEDESARGLLELLQSGKDVALVSDAGTPGVSDPGFKLVREAAKAGVKIVPIPGASSLTTALSVAAIGGRRLFFGGFAPSSSKERRAEIESARAAVHKFAYLESPHRVVEHLEDVLAVLGDTDVCIARELTKTFEEVLTCTVKEALTHFAKKPPKGEFVLIYLTQDPEPGAVLEKLEETIVNRLNDGASASDIVKEFQGQTALKKKALYDLVLKLQKKISK